MSPKPVEEYPFLEKGPTNDNDLTQLQGHFDNLENHAFEQVRVKSRRKSLDLWHTVRIERSIESQTIEVFFDGKLTLSSEDTTIAWGRIGVGSFDDTARFRHIRIWAKEVRDADGSPW